MAKPPSNRKKATSAASSNDTPPDNLIQEENPALATINVTAVEVSELTEREQSDRLLLERKVERAFFEAGKALAELRDRRLYRSTHRTFEEYCRDALSCAIVFGLSLGLALTEDVNSIFCDLNI